MSPQLQLLPPVPPPVGLYIRPGWNDHIVLQQLVVEGRAPTGIVFDSRYGARQRDLLDVALDAKLDTVLDPGLLELWTPAGRTLPRIMDLPWSWAADEGEPGLRGEAGRQLVATVADYVVDYGYGSVVSPSHYLRSATDPSLSVDLHLARLLRDALNARGRSEVRIYYRLAMPAAELGVVAAPRTVMQALSRLDIDSLWLRLHPFGTSASGPYALKRYIDICLALQGLNVPLVAERTGTVGIALLSVNAVGGIECGVTLGERFDAGRLLRLRPSGQPFSNPGLVYFQSIDTFVTRGEGREILSRRATKVALGCRDMTCCRRGPDDMVRDPRRHGVIQRIREADETGQTPAHRRHERYLEHVTNAGNLAVRLAQAHPVLEPARKRLDSWRGTLSAIPNERIQREAPMPALGRRLHASPPRPRPIASNAQE